MDASNATPLAGVSTWLRAPSGTARFRESGSRRQRPKRDVAGRWDHRSLEMRRAAAGTSSWLPVNEPGPGPVPSREMNISERRSDEGQAAARAELDETGHGQPEGSDVLRGCGPGDALRELERTAAGSLAVTPAGPDRRGAHAGPQRSVQRLVLPSPGPARRGSCSPAVHRSSSEVTIRQCPGYLEVGFSKSPDRSLIIQMAPSGVPALRGAPGGAIERAPPVSPRAPGRWGTLANVISPSGTAGRYRSVPCR